MEKGEWETDTGGRTHPKLSISVAVYANVQKKLHVWY